MREGLWLLAVRRAGSLVGLAPLFIYLDPSTRKRQVTLLGNGISDRLDMLAAPAHAEAVGSAVFDHLARRTELWDSCDFRDLPQNSALLNLPLPFACADKVSPEEPCPVVGLPKNADEMIAVLPRSRRGELRRRARRLGELGALAFDAARSESLRHYLSELLRLHQSRWNARGEEGVLADATMQDFHSEATQALMHRGMLRLDVLTLDGKVIAAHYGLRHATTAYSYIHGFDPEFAAFGASALLIAHVIEEAVRDGYLRFDFLRGREPYKYSWGARDMPQFRRSMRR